MQEPHADHSSDGQRQCRRGVAADVELDAAMALADMASAGPGAPAAVQVPPVQHIAAQATAAEHEDEVPASTRLSLELGKVGIQSSSCSGGSSAGAGHPAQQALQVAAAAPGYGPRPRHMLTEAEKEAKRLRRVLANRESARQTIRRRQAIRDELARKVADLSSQNESMKKEKDTVVQEFILLKETNKQLKEQVARSTAKKASAPVTEAMDTSPVAQQAEAMPPSTATPTHTPPPQASFLYTVPVVWGSWPPGYEHADPGAGPAPAPLCLPPCAWYYPVVADTRGSPTSYPQPFQGQPRAASGGGSPGGGTAEEDTDDDPCSLTLAIDVDKQKGTSSTQGGGGGEVGLQGALSEREKAATAAEARKRRRGLTKLKRRGRGGGG